MLHRFCNQKPYRQPRGAIRATYADAIQWTVDKHTMLGEARNKTHSKRQPATSCDKRRLSRRRCTNARSTCYSIRYNDADAVHCRTHPAHQKTAARHTQSLSIPERRTRPPPRTHTRHRPQEACQPERKAQSPAPHAARHTDSPRRSRLSSGHCPLSTALASATAPASPMWFPVAPIPHIRTQQHDTRSRSASQSATHALHPARTRATDRKKHASRSERRRAQHSMRQDTQTHR